MNLLLLLLSNINHFLGPCVLFLPYLVTFGVSAGILSAALPLLPILLPFRQKGQKHLNELS